MAENNAQSNNSPDTRQLGEKLRMARKYLGLEQSEVASYLRLSLSDLSSVESGQRQASSDELARLARFYRQPLSHFTTTQQDQPAEFTHDIPHLARRVARLSQQDRDELTAFVAYLSQLSRLPKDIT